MNRLKALRSVGRRSASALRSLPTDLRLLGRGLLLVGSGTPRAATAHVALVLLLALLPVLQVWLTKLLLDAVTTRTEGVTAAVSWAVTLAAVYALTLVVLAALTPIQRVLSAWIEERAIAELDSRLIRAGTRLADLVRLERPAFQDRLRLVRQAASQDLPGLFPLLEMGGTPLLSLVGLLLLLGFLHPLLPVVLAAVSVPHFVSEYRMNRLQYQAMARQSRPAREMDYCAAVTTEPAAAKEVRVFGLGDFFLQRFRERRDAALGEMTRVRLVQLKMSTVFSGAYALVLAGGFWYVAVQAGAGRLTLGDLALYLGAVTQAQSVATRMSVWFGLFYGVLARLRALFDFLDQARPAIKLPPPEQGRRAPALLEQEVALRQVSFRYPEGTQAVLADVSVVLPAGRVTALVGANGAGKSTLVKLLTRMYDPDTGAILLDGTPLDEYDLASWRRRIAVVYQDFAQFALTFHENIAVGAYAADARPGRIEQAAQWAGADEVAAQLPRGYATELTRQFAGGVELSGGEWQKVALARGFVRDAALVILDEPTAALDAEAEYRLFEQFRELVQGKTALIISHRFSTVRMADHIVVLDEGRVVEAGSHAALVAQGGRYATLYEMQAGRYR